MIFIAKYKELAIDNSNKVMSLDLKVMKNSRQKRQITVDWFCDSHPIGGFGDAKVDFYVSGRFFLPGTGSTACRRQDYEVLVWTINTDEALEKYGTARQNGIITDKVALAKPFKSTKPTTV